jgi:ABC-2 type transport system ATP-binding protein
MTTVIELVGVVKDYGDLRALDGVDLEVRTGEVFGFIGPNGAGKSTTIRILLDLLRPSSGTVRVLGEDPRAGGPALRARLGYLPGELSLEGSATARQLLGHLAAVRGGRGADRITSLAERFLLDLDRPLRTLSKGNRQKVGVVQALMHQPELALLDEPTSGLDPLLQQEFLTLVREVRAAGVSVFLSSHVLSEIEGVADRVALVRDGRIVIVDDVAGLRSAAGQRLDVTFEGDVPRAALAAIDELVIEGRRATGVLRGDPRPLLAALGAERVIRLELRDRDLEELVLDAYRSVAPGPDPASDANPAADAHRGLDAGGAR